MHLGAQSAWDQSVVGRNPPLPFCILICRFLGSPYANPSPVLSLRASLSDTFLQKDAVNQCLEFDLLCQWNLGQYQQQTPNGGLRQTSFRRQVPESGVRSVYQHWSVLAGCPLIFHLAGLPHVKCCLHTLGGFWREVSCSGYNFIDVVMYACYFAEKRLCTSQR